MYKFLSYSFMMIMMMMTCSVVDVAYIEKFKSDIADDVFRQQLLKLTNAQTICIDETKRPTYQPVNESFRKLTVD